MALVLTDGSAASAKALDLGMVPNLFLDHDTEQLVILHAWRDSKDLAQMAAIPAAVEHVAKSRVAANTLNYKIELVKLPPLAAVPDGTVDGGNAQPAPPAPPAPAAAAPKGAKKGAAAPAAAEVVEAPTAVADSTATEVDEAENEAKRDNAKIADYITDRTAHFGLKNVILGVGTGQQGKNLIVGSTARNVLSTFGASHNLFFLKQSGPLVRPGAAMRINALVVPGSDLSHVRYALSIAQPEKKGDRVGVTIVVNNGKPKPQEGVLSVAHATDDDGTPAPGDVAKECAELLAAHGLVDNTTDDGNSTAADTFPLISYLTLEPVNNNPTPKVDDEKANNQVVKWFSGMKVDFVALPPKKEGFNESLYTLFLGAQKPHVLTTASE